jgi:dihydroorotate dehydrogenase (fumarate)
VTIDLSTNYLTLKLRNPIVASASPLTGDLETLRRLEDAGVSAAVLPSLFEEQIVRDELRINDLFEYQAEATAESLTFFPPEPAIESRSTQAIRRVEESKKAVSIPIIASLNGSSPGGWSKYARSFEDAGADALELNIYFIPTDPHVTSEDVEQSYLELVASVRHSVSIPIAVKIGSQFTNLANFVPRLAQAGADGVVLFNRYLEPDIDLELLHVTPSLVLSHRHELRQPLRWIAILRDHLTCSIAATSGVHEPQDAAKLLLAGADACLTASALLRRGVEHATTLVEGLRLWMEEKQYDSVEQLKGSMSYRNCPDAGALERANYMQALASYTLAH